jgi:hypothetical protein
MFASLPEHHFPMPAGLAVPGAVYARTMSLTTHAAWYVLTVRFLEDDLTAQTFLLAWDTDVADAIRTGQGHVEVESLMFVTPTHADSQIRWQCKQVTEIWSATDPADDDREYILMVTEDGQEHSGYFMSSENKLKRQALLAHTCPPKGARKFDA